MEHISHFKYVLTDVGRYSLLRKLHDRAEVNETETKPTDLPSNKRQRQDIEGVTASVDVRATMALINHRDKNKHDKEENAAEHRRSTFAKASKLVWPATLSAVHV